MPDLKDAMQDISKMDSIPELDNLFRAFKEMIKVHLAYIQKKEKPARIIYRTKTVIQPKIIYRQKRNKKPLQEAMEQSPYFNLPRTFGSLG